MMRQSHLLQADHQALKNAGRSVACELVNDGAGRSRPADLDPCHTYSSVGTCSAGDRWSA